MSAAHTKADLDSALAAFHKIASVMVLSAKRDSSMVRSERGLALLIVIFIITLAGALVISMAETTYVSMRMNRASEQRVQAEYLLKSAVNFARVLIKDDASPSDDDPVNDIWFTFVNGQIIPGDLLGLRLLIFGFTWRLR